MPLDGERTVEDIIDRVAVFQCHLKRRICHRPGSNQGEGQCEQVSIDVRRFVSRHLLTNHDARPQRTRRLHENQVGSEEFDFIIQEFL